MSYRYNKAAGSKDRDDEKFFSNSHEETEQDEDEFERTQLSGNFISLMCFWPAVRIANASWKRALRSTDSWDLTEHDTSTEIAKEFGRVWEEECQKEAPSVVSVAIRHSLGLFVISTLFLIVNIAWSLVTPALLPFFIRYLQNENMPNWWGWVYSACIIAASMISALLERHADILLQKAALRLMSGLQMLIFEKVLKISSTENSSEILSLMSSDTQTIGNEVPRIAPSLLDPVRVVAITVLLWFQIDYFCFVPLVILIVIFPLAAWTGTNNYDYFMEAQSKRDERIQIITELFNYIRIVKYYTWEKVFKRKILKVRTKELDSFNTAYNWAIWMMTMLIAAPDFSVACTFIFFGFFREPDLAVLFTSLALLENMKETFISLPMILTNFAQILGCFRRIQVFLERDELPVHPVAKASVNNPPRMEITDGDFSWDNSEEKLTLSNVNLKVVTGRLTMVVGPAGSGKSSLVHAVLGELPQLYGGLEVVGTIAYVPQQAWIFNATVRENILFGKPYDNSLFQQVIEASALTKDIKFMPSGDETEIGEHGLNLSEGQKQKVAIARALYAQKDNYIFDDPLSAVDTNVGKYIFTEVFMKFLKNKTVLFITSKLQYLPSSDYVVFIVSGQIEAQGKYYDVLSQHTTFAQMMENVVVGDEEEKLFESSLSTSLGISLGDVTTDDSMEDYDHEHGFLGLGSSHKFSASESEADENWDPSHKFGRRKTNRALRMLQNISKTNKKFSESFELPVQKTNIQQAAVKYKRIEQEEHEDGQGWRLYWWYISSGGAWFFIGILIMLMRQSSLVMSIWWLAYWPSDYNTRKGTQTQRAETFYVYTYMGFNAVAVISMGVYFKLMAIWGLKAAKYLHSKCVSRTIRAPISFFDTTPVGKILARFTTDMSITDTALWISILDSIIQAIVFLGLVTSVGIGAPWILLTLPLFIVAFFWLQKYFHRVSVQIQKLEAVSRVPLYSHLAETLVGITTVRAFNSENRFVIENQTRVQVHNCDWFALKYAYGWYGLFLTYLGNIMLILGYIMVVLTKTYLRNTIFFDIGYLTIPLTLAPQIASNLREFARYFAMAETRMNAAVRVKTYMDMPQEAPAIIEKRRPPRNWPKKGVIEFKKLTMRYRKGTNRVLHGINASIRAHEKVGIVGRAASGKSSLIHVLFRMVEPEEGKILIDGLDITSIGLEDLRSRIGIIPQELVMFSGTLRQNLDPFSHYDDRDIWYALELTHLKEQVNALPDKLAEQIVEGGSNFTLGQRQLISMARVLLMRPKILIMDEATYFDTETDLLIQRIIRTAFLDTTLLIVAQRLNTVMDMDRIMVLDRGRIVEFDSPKILVADKLSILFGMIEATGPTSAQHLINIANGQVGVKI